MFHYSYITQSQVLVTSCSFTLNELLILLVPSCLGVSAEARVFVPVHGGGGGGRGGGNRDAPYRVRIPIPQDQSTALQNVYGIRYGAEAFPPPPPYQPPAPIQEDSSGNVAQNGGGGLPPGLYSFPPPLQQQEVNTEVEGNGVNSALYRYPPQQQYQQAVPIRVNVVGNGQNGSPQGLYGFPQTPAHLPLGIVAGNGYGHQPNRFPTVSLPVDQRKPFGANGLTYGTQYYPSQRQPAPIYEDMGPDIPPNGANGVGTGVQGYAQQAALVGQYGAGPVVSTAQAVVQGPASSGQVGVATFGVASPGQLKASAQSEMTALQQGLRLADLNKLRLSGSAGLGQLGTLGVEELSQVLGSQGVAGPHMNPVFATLLMGSLIPSPALGIGHNHFRAQHHHLQGLLLKHYGKYLPYGLGSYGLYGYSASNNVHNSNAFGPYKYEHRV